MKKVALISVLALVAVGAFAQPVPRDAVSLGDRWVDFHATHDVIGVGTYDGWFHSIVFYVERNNVEIYNITVTYGDGQTQRFGTRLVFDQGTRSRYLDLAGERRLIRRIDFDFQTVGIWFEGRAHVLVYGIR